MARESRHISAWIERPAAEVYEYAREPGNLPAWAAGIGGSLDNVAFVERNEFGVLDHYVTLPSGDVVYSPMRVIPDGDAAEVVFTLRRLPDMSDTDFARDAGLLRADLTRLKQILEGAG